MVRCSKARLADWALAALFLVHFIVIYPSLLSIVPRSPWEVTEQWNKFGTAAFVSVLFGLGWAGAIWKMTTDTATATKAFTMSQVAASVLFATHALLLALNGVWSLAILLGAIAFADYVWMQRARERITFLVEVLRLVQALVQSRLREIAALSMLLAGLQFAFILLWVAAITRVIQLPSTGGVATVMLLMLLSFRWTTGMIKHALTHVVAVQVTHALKRAAEASRFAAQITPRLRSLTEAADSEEDVTVLLTAPGGVPHPSGTPARAGAFSSADVAAAVGGRPHHRPGDVGAGGQTAALKADGQLDAALAQVERTAAAAAPDAGSAAQGRPDGGVAERRAGDASARAPAASAVAYSADGSGVRAAALGQLGVVSAASAAGVPIAVAPPDLPVPADPLAVAASAATPPPHAALLRACTRNFGALASGALLGFASPLAWACRRGARAAARRFAAADFAGFETASGRRLQEQRSQQHGRGHPPISPYGETSGGTDIAAGGAGSDASFAANGTLGDAAGSAVGGAAAAPSASSRISHTLSSSDLYFAEDYRAPRAAAAIPSSTSSSGAAGGGAFALGSSGAPTPRGALGVGGQSFTPRDHLPRTPGARARRQCTRACDSCVGALALRSLALSEWYLRSTHKYAHVLVATQDRSWCAAAASSWAELQRSGVDGIIDDDVTDRMLLFGGYVGGAVLSLLLGTTVQTPDMATWLWSAALVFAIGFTGVTLPLTVLEASTSTLFVAFAQVPETLAACHPILYHRFERLTEVYAHTRGREALFAIGRAPRDDLVDRL